VNVIFIGDITGPEGVALVAEAVPKMRSEHAADLVIANADNVAVTGAEPMGGSGMTIEPVELLLRSGVDLVTSGTHAWDSPESGRVLNLPKVLRAYNLPSGEPGCGIIELETAGEAVTVINLAGTAMVPNSSPAYASWRTARKQGLVIVHFVGSPHDTRVFAYAIDGQAAAVLGTLGHEATLHHYILPGGTGLVPDVGMTGPLGGIGGFDARNFVARLKGENDTNLPPYTLVDGPMTLGAVLLRIETGRCREIERL